MKICNFQPSLAFTTGALAFGLAPVSFSLNQLANATLTHCENMWSADCQKSQLLSERNCRTIYANSNGCQSEAFLFGASTWIQNAIGATVVGLIMVYQYRCLLQEKREDQLKWRELEGQHHANPSAKPL